MAHLHRVHAGRLGERQVRGPVRGITLRFLHHRRAVGTAWGHVQASGMFLSSFLPFGS